MSIFNDTDNSGDDATNGAAVLTLLYDKFFYSPVFLVFWLTRWVRKQITGAIQGSRRQKKAYLYGLLGKSGGHPPENAEIVARQLNSASMKARAILLWNIHWCSGPNIMSSSMALYAASNTTEANMCTSFLILD